MTRRAPGFARAFAGRWRITEMDEWDEIDLLGAAHITFSGKDNGELVFIAIEADLDVYYGARDGAPCAEFSWHGFDDGSPTIGRGRAALGAADRPVGHIFINKGDNLGFIAERSDFFNSLSGRLRCRRAVTCCFPCLPRRRFVRPKPLPPRKPRQRRLCCAWNAG
jgi:hypothetical protein